MTGEPDFTWLKVMLMFDFHYSYFSRISKVHLRRNGRNRFNPSGSSIRNISYLALIATIGLSLGLSGCGGTPVHGAMTTPGTLSATPATVDFGSVNVGNSANQQVSVSNGSSAPVQISELTTSNASFSVEETLPVSIPAGGALSLRVHYSPTTITDSSAQMSIMTSTSTNAATTVKLHGKGSKGGASTQPSLSSISCQSSSLSGAGTDNCTVSLSSAATSGSVTVNLSSNSTAVSVPSSLAVPAGSSTATFTATVAAVSSTQSVILTASANGTSNTFVLQLNASAPSVPTLSASTTSLSFGSVALNTAVTKSISLTSTGTAPVNISAGTLTGAGFSVSGATFPATLNPGQAIVLTAQFAPTAAGSVTGQLAIASNSSTNSTIAVSLSGAGASAAPSVSAINCSSSSMTGSGTDACTVTLSGSAPTGGSAVSLSSSNQAVTVPASVTVPATATSAGFAATVSAVSTAQSATVTASAGGASKGFALQLNAAAPILSINASSVSFGSVVVNSATTQTLTLSSTGSAPVTVNAASVTGAGFTVSGATLPVTLNPGQSTSLTLQFAPTAVGSATGQLTITSNSSSGATAVLSLSGTGAPHEVDLSWSAPTGSSDPAVGFNVYRAPTGTTSYQLSGQVAQTVFADTTVQSGQTYDYIVKSVDSANVESAPSNITTVKIP